MRTIFSQYLTIFDNISQIFKLLSQVSSTQSVLVDEKKTILGTILSINQNNNNNTDHSNTMRLLG